MKASRQACIRPFGNNGLIAEIFEPEQHDGAVERAELVDAFAQHFDLSAVVVVVFKKVDALLH